MKQTSIPPPTASTHKLNWPFLRHCCKNLRSHNVALRTIVRHSTSCGLDVFCNRALKSVFATLHRSHTARQNESWIYVRRGMPVLRNLPLVFCVMFSVPTAAIADGERLNHGKTISFRNVSTQQEKQFAEEQIITHFRDESGPLFEGSISEWKLTLAEADLNDDGIPEKLVMINESYWCGSAGCQGLLLRKEGLQWSLITRPTISEERTVLLSEKMFGYHKLYTGGAVYTFKNGNVHQILDLDTNEVIK